MWRHLCGNDFVLLEAARIAPFCLESPPLDQLVLTSLCCVRSDCMLTASGYLPQWTVAAAAGLLVSESVEARSFRHRRPFGQHERTVPTFSPLSQTALD